LSDAEKKICLQLVDILSFSGRKFGFNVFHIKILRKILKKIKISNFIFGFFFVFFNKFMLSECSLAISRYFYTPKYPKKIATATLLRRTFLPKVYQVRYKDGHFSQKFAGQPIKTHWARAGHL
jgi:hypothetical protein